MPLAVYRYFLHFACVCHTQGPANNLCTWRCPKQLSLRARLFHLTPGIDYSGWKTLLCTAQSLSIPWLQHCIPAGLPRAELAWLWATSSVPVSLLPCPAQALSLWALGRERSLIPLRPCIPTASSAVLAQQLLIQLSSQSVTSSLVPVQMFYKSASGEQWAEEMLRSDSTVRSNWFLLTSRTNYEIIFPVCCS